jgi:hypothetical protein
MRRNAKPHNHHNFNSTFPPGCCEAPRVFKKVQFMTAKEIREILANVPDSATVFICTSYPVFFMRTAQCEYDEEKNFVLLS